MTASNSCSKERMSTGEEGLEEGKTESIQIGRSSGGLIPGGTKCSAVPPEAQVSDPWKFISAGGEGGTHPKGNVMTGQTGAGDAN